MSWIIWERRWSTAALSHTMQFEPSSYQPIACRTWTLPEGSSQPPQTGYAQPSLPVLLESTFWNWRMTSNLWNGNHPGSPSNLEERRHFLSASWKFQNVFERTQFQQSVCMTEARWIWAATILPSTFLHVLCTLDASLSPLLLPTFALCQFRLPFHSPDCPSLSPSLPHSSQCLFLHFFSSLPPSAPWSHPLPPLWSSGSEGEILTAFPMEIAQGLSVYSTRLWLRAMLVSAKATLTPTVWSMCLPQCSFLILYYPSAKVELEESGRGTEGSSF